MCSKQFVRKNQKCRIEKSCLFNLSSDENSDSSHSTSSSTFSVTNCASFDNVDLWLSNCCSVDIEPTELLKQGSGNLELELVESAIDIMPQCLENSKNEYLWNMLEERKQTINGLLADFSKFRQHKDCKRDNHKSVWLVNKIEDIMKENVDEDCLHSLREFRDDLRLTKAGEIWSQECERRCMHEMMESNDNCDVLISPQLN